MKQRKPNTFSLEAHDVLVANHEKRVERAVRLLRAAVAARDAAYELEHPQCGSTKTFTSISTHGGIIQTHRCELRMEHAGRHADTRGKRSWR